MPPQDAEDPRGPATLRARLRPDAEIGEVADAILAQWGEIARALEPIIGRRGVAALYHRSLQLVARTHPWLGAVPSDALASIDPAALKAVMRQQSARDAIEGGDAFFETFRELLASLVGAPLTERLLRAVWTSSQGGAPEQDTLP